ncbi:MAG: hypothetical protein K1V75_02440 [Muribaculaceae bacterium]
MDAKNMLSAIPDTLDVCELMEVQGGFSIDGNKICIFGSAVKNECSTGTPAVAYCPSGAAIALCPNGAAVGDLPKPPVIPPVVEG